MSVRLRYKVSVAVSSTNAESNDLGNTAFEVVTDAPNDGGVWKTKLAAGQTRTLNLDDITSATFLMLRMTPTDPTLQMTPVNLSLNGAVQPLTLKPIGDMDETLFLATTQSITQVTVANTDPAAVDIDIIIGTSGD